MEYMQIYSVTSAKKAAGTHDTSGEVTTSEVSLHELFC